MIRRLLCLALLLLAACSGTPSADLDPAYPDQPTYQAFVRQHLMLTEGKVLAHFPGLLDCEVAESIEGYTPEEMKALDAYAQDRDSDMRFAARKAQREHAARIPDGQFLANHPECANIHAQPDSFADGRDYIMQSFLNHNEPLFDQKSVNPDLRQETAACYWNVFQTRLSPEEQQALDDFARGGPRPASFRMPYVNHDHLKAACPQTMARLDAFFVVYTYRYTRDYMSTWPGRS